LPILRQLGLGGVMPRSKTPCAVLIALLLAATANEARTDAPRPIAASTPVEVARGVLTKAARADNWAEMLAGSERALELVPNIYGGLVYRATALRGLGRHRESIEVGRLLVRIYPNQAQSWVELGHSMQASEDLSLTQEAIAAYGRALVLAPKYERAYALRGEILAASGDKTRTEINYRNWLVLSPKDARAWASFGAALEKLDEPKRARQMLSRSLELEPTQQAYRARAKLVMGEDLAAASSDIDSAFALGPPTTAMLVTRGEIRAAKAEYALALEDLTRALELWPTSLSALRVRSGVYLDTRRYREAIDDLDRMLVIRPGYPTYLNSRCWTRALGGLDLDKALADCTAALKESPKNGAYLDTLGTLQLRMRDAKSALASFNAALARNPDQTESLFGRGLAKIIGGDRTGGEADLAAARARSPKAEVEFRRHGLDS